MMFDYSKLQGKIKEKYETQERFAKLIGVSESTLSLKLNCKTEFKQCEILEACSVLGINLLEVSEYFFTQKVVKSQQTNKAG